MYRQTAHTVTIAFSVAVRYPSTNCNTSLISVIRNLHSTECARAIFHTVSQPLQPGGTQI